MQAACILSASPAYKGCLPSDRALLRGAYNFVRGCQEYLPKLAAEEDARETKLKAKAPRWPEGPTVRFNEAAQLITKRSKRRATGRFRQFLKEDPNYDEVRQLFEDRGVPKKHVSQLRREFARWDPQNIRQTNQTSAKKNRKKRLER